MITDDLLRVSEDQVLTGITDTSALSTDKIDLSLARDIGEGEPLYMNFAITTAVTVGTSTRFEVVIADDAALTTNVESVGDSGAIATANLTLGKNIVVPIRPNIASRGRRYMGCRYTVVGTNTTGKVTADLVHGIQGGRKFYSSGFSVT